MILDEDGTFLAAASARQAWVFDTRSSERVWESVVDDGALFVSAAPGDSFVLMHLLSKQSPPNIRHVELWSLDSSPMERAVMSVEDDPFGIRWLWNSGDDSFSNEVWYVPLGFPWVAEVGPESSGLVDIWPLVNEDTEGDNPAEVEVLGYGPLAAVTHHRGGPVTVVNLSGLEGFTLPLFGPGKSSVCEGDSIGDDVWVSFSDTVYRVDLSTLQTVDFFRVATTDGVPLVSLLDWNVDAGLLTLRVAGSWPSDTSLVVSVDLVGRSVAGESEVPYDATTVVARDTRVLAVTSAGELTTHQLGASNVSLVDPREPGDRDWSR